MTKITSTWILVGCNSVNVSWPLDMAYKLFCQQGKVTVLSDETPCNLVERYHRLLRACWSISKNHCFFTRNQIKGYEVLKMKFVQEWRITPEIKYSQHYKYAPWNLHKNKVKIESPCAEIKHQDAKKYGGMEVYLQGLTSEIEESVWLASRLAKVLGSHWKACWVNSRAGWTPWRSELSCPGP